MNLVKSLETPLLIHANTNDEDVNYLEVEHLIQALKAEGKKFDYKVYENAPGGHYFNGRTQSWRATHVWRFTGFSPIICIRRSLRSRCYLQGAYGTTLKTSGSKAEFPGAELMKNCPSALDSISGIEQGTIAMGGRP